MTRTARIDRRGMPEGLDGADFFAVVEASPDFVAIASIDNRVLYVNPAGRSLLGLESLEEAILHPIADYLSPEGWRASLEVEQPAVVRYGFWQGRSSLRHFRTGAEIPVEITSFVVDGQDGRVLLATFQHDVRDELRLAERLRTAQNLEAAGRLAGAVAHDFNNLLMVILGYAQLIADGRGDGSRSRAQAEEILRAANQGAQLTRQLLALARGRADSSPASDVNAVILDNSSLMHRLVGEQIECVIELVPGEACVGLDETRLMQVFLNLCANARDAMPGGGRITISTAWRDEEGGRAIAIAFADSGTGIPSDLLPRVFEPFVTTKKESGGTGLGLANVAGIAAEVGGRVEIESVEHAGTTVTIVLPEIEAGGTGEQAAPSAGGSERICLVEPDPAVRQIVSLTLEAAGYVVEAAEQPDGLLDAHEPDLVVADVALPLVEALRRRRPELPIVLIGQVAPEAADGIEVLAKPFLPAELLRRIRSLLDLR